MNRKTIEERVPRHQYKGFNMRKVIIAGNWKMNKTIPEAMELVSRLDRPSPDRSRRDFAIVCDLLRLGLAKEEIWNLVSCRSKFESNGRPYFDLTFSNAERSIVLDGMPRSPSRVGA